MKPIIKSVILTVCFLFFVNLPCFASKLPNDLYDYIKKNLPEGRHRFDSVILLKDDSMYIPLYPAEKATPEKIEVIYTYPSGKNLKQKPEVVIFNNNFVLLKAFKKNGKYTVTTYEDLPVKVKLGIMPQDMLTPPGLYIPENLKLILGDLVIPTNEEGELKMTERQENIAQGIKIPPIPELKNKKMLALTRGDNFLLVVEPSVQEAMYKLKLAGVPIKSVASNSLKFGAVIYYHNNKIDVIDLKHERIIAQPEVEEEIDDITLDTVKNTAYITSSKGNTIYALDMNSGKIVKKIKLTYFPERIFAGTDGKNLIFSDKYTGELFLLELNDEYTSSYVMTEPNISNAVFDGENLYAISRTDSTLKIIDPFAKVLKGIIDVGKKPTDLFFFKDKIYILCAEGKTVDVFDMTKGIVVKSVKLDEDGFFTKITPVKDKNLAIITGLGAKKMIIFDLEKMTVIQTRPLNANITDAVVIDK